MNRSNRYGVLVLRRIGLSSWIMVAKVARLKWWKNLRQFDRTKMEQWGFTRNKFVAITLTDPPMLWLIQRKSCRLFSRPKKMVCVFMQEMLQLRFVRWYHLVASGQFGSYKILGIYDHILQWTDIDGFLSSLLNSLLFISGPGKLMLVWHRLALSESIAA